MSRTLSTRMPSRICSCSHEEKLEEGEIPDSQPSSPVAKVSSPVPKLSRRPSSPVLRIFSRSSSPTPHAKIYGEPFVSPPSPVLGKRTVDEMLKNDCELDASGNIVPKGDADQLDIFMVNFNFWELRVVQDLFTDDTIDKVKKLATGECKEKVETLFCEDDMMKRLTKLAKVETYEGFKTLADMASKDITELGINYNDFLGKHKKLQEAAAVFYNNTTGNMQEAAKNLLEAFEQAKKISDDFHDEYTTSKRHEGFASTGRICSYLK